MKQAGASTDKDVITSSTRDSAADVADSWSAERCNGLNAKADCSKLDIGMKPGQSHIEEMTD